MEEPHRWSKFEIVLVILVGFAMLYVALLAYSQAKLHYRRDLARQVEVWYADPSYQFLVPTLQPIGSRYLPGMPVAQVALELLKAPPAWLVSPVPGAEAPVILVATASEATVQVRLTAAVGATEERLLVGAVVRTLTALPGIGTVRIRTVDAAGRPREGHEDAAGAFSAQSPEGRNVWDSPGQIPITVWYQLASGSYLVPLEIGPADAERPIESAVTALSSGPPAGVNGLRTAVPRDTGLRFKGMAGSTVRLEWARPDVPADPDARRRLIAAAVLTMTAYGALVRFESPAGLIDRTVGEFDLRRDLSANDARRVLEIRAITGSQPVKKAS